MSRIRMPVWIVAAALAVVPASAETFHSQDGVLFEGNPTQGRPPGRRLQRA